MAHSAATFSILSRGAVGLVSTAPAKHQTQIAWGIRWQVASQDQGSAVGQFELGDYSEEPVKESLRTNLAKTLDLGVLDLSRKTAADRKLVERTYQALRLLRARAGLTPVFAQRKPWFHS